MYNEKVMQTFANPKHVGEVENYDGIGKVGNASCGYHADHAEVETSSRTRSSRRSAAPRRRRHSPRRIWSSA
ncbi:MAG: iron-sulfur cluster assembly scaffold protein [Christensenellaceae bacterium]